MTRLKRSALWRPTLLAAVAGTALPALAQFTFDPALNTPAVERPDTIAAADLNGDGATDAALTLDTPDRIAVHFKTGDVFGAPVFIFPGAGTGAGYLTAVDIDGDMDRDLLVALHNVNMVRVYLNNGAGVFSPGASVAVGANPRWIATGDWNGDGAADLATADRDGNTATILTNTGGGAAFATATIAVGEEPRAVAAGDQDGDGDMDLVVSISRDRTLMLLRNAGGVFSVFGSLPVSANLRPDGVVAADLDGDSDMDIASATSGNGLNFVGVWLNAGGGAYAGPVNYAAGGVNPGVLVASDLNCDGRLDLATANQDSANVSALANLGGGTFGAAQVLAVGTNPGSLIAANTDGDRDRELLTANRDSNDWSLLVNQTCAPVLVADMNCDGLVNNFDIDPFVLALSNPAQYHATFPNCDISAGDANGDGLVNNFDIDPFVAILSGV
ncbi:MAG: FG-GAP repeat domain-containing protein [Phycisphaerae bacterium]